jgi:hypothetical protein
MMKIFKYEVPIVDDFALLMPSGAEVLAFQVQRGVPCIWARVDERADLVQRNFHVIGTGNPMPDVQMVYIGTVQMPPFVWHLFEEGGR